MSYQNIEQLKEMYLQLLHDGYVEADNNGHIIFTPKFHQAIVGIHTPVLADVAVIGDNSMIIAELQKDWTIAFMNFIMECKVPQRQETRSGDSYDLNKYSTEAMKVFRKAIEKEGIVYTVLVKSTMLYYKTSNQYKKHIGNYFTQGIWRTDYYALVNSVKEGTVETHIKDQINEPRSQWKLG